MVGYQGGLDERPAPGR